METFPVELYDHSTVNYLKTAIYLVHCRGVDPNDVVIFRQIGQFSAICITVGMPSLAPGRGSSTSMPVCSHWAKPGELVHTGLRVSGTTKRRGKDGNSSPLS